MEGVSIMPIFDIFSKRQKALRGDMPDVYSYDCIPTPLRVQIVYIICDALGNERHYNKIFNDDYKYSEVIYGYPEVRKSYDFITDTLCREYGVFRLPVSYKEIENKMNDLLYFLLHEKNIEKTIDAIELSFRVIGSHTRTHDYLRKEDPSGDADRAIEELNHRFKEHGVGYCFTDGQIVRIDSEFVHSEVVRPALGILDQGQYAGARQEFLKAHEHYRKGNTKEALNECLKSFESVMKSICDKREWAYDERATASTLIGICFDKQLIPSFWQTQFAALRSLLESGVPTARNKLSGHGQGAAPMPVPGHIAGYVLHMTAAAIVFLAEAEASGNAP